MKTTTVEAFNIIGIAIRTTNENGQSASDIPALWGKFMSENVLSKIPNKIDYNIYCVYTDYEKDHTRPYTTLLGCRVKNLDTIPEGMTGKSFSGGNYTTFTAKGKLMEGAVFNEWTKIWNSDLDRAYTADFEIYGEKSQDPENGEADILVAVNIETLDK
jgi:predicted transcriptional regulator YdeE